MLGGLFGFKLVLLVVLRSRSILFKQERWEELLSLQGYVLFLQQSIEPGG